MKKKLIAFILVATFVVSLAQPSQSHAADMLPRITSLPGTLEILNS